MSSTLNTWKDKSAKVQVSESDLPSSVPPQTGLTFNIWYNKWSQGQNGQERFVNPFRLEPQLHSGITNGDKEGNAFFCLYFAKGMCCLGKKCAYKHHIPQDEDIQKLSLKTDVLDCFGREKFGDYRDDMGGVGSFRKNNRTIYIGGLMGALNNKTLKPSQIESRLRFMFSRLGELDRIRFIESKNCAFVTYRYQANAEFAKEVMSNQTLLTVSDKEWDERKEGTGLLMKWANDDPDPASKQREQDYSKKMAFEVLGKLLDDSNKRERMKRKHEDSSNNEDTTCTVIFNESVLDTLRAKRFKKIDVIKAGDVSISKTEPISKLVDYISSDDDT